MSLTYQGQTHPDQTPASSHREEIKAALRYSTVDGMAYASMIGFGEHYIVAYAVALRATSLQIGLLCAAPSLLAALAQTKSADMARALGSRKAIVLIFALLQGLMWLPIMVIPFVFATSPGWWLIAFVTMYTAFGAVVTPCWASTMAEVVPDRLRGEYFGRRGSLSTLASIIVFLVAGIFLYYFTGELLVAFAALFGAAFFSRLVSWVFLTKLPEFSPTVKKEEPLKPGAFVKVLTGTNLGRAMAFLILMSFVVNIASPYFAVYMLRDLGLSYLAFAILETCSSVATLLTLTHWGEAADKVGNFKMLAIASIMVPLVPLIWLASDNLIYLGIVQLFTGFAWAGFNLCSVNFLYDATSARNRTVYLSYFNALNGIAASLGAIIGGYSAPYLPILFGYGTLTLFLISGYLRGIVSMAFLPEIKEVRRVSAIKATQLFHILMAGRPVNRRASHRRVAHIHAHRNRAAA